MASSPDSKKPPLPCRSFGRTGLDLPTLGYGSMGLRGPRTWGVRVVDEAQAEELLNAVVDAGIRLIDTSPDYGLSEQRIGDYLHHRRHEIILATKCGCVYTQHADHLELQHEWTIDVIRRNLDLSLQRLRTSTIDIWQFHGGDAETLQHAGLIDWGLKLKEQGVIRWLGVSTSLPQLPQLLALDVFDTLQVPYSCLDPRHALWLERAAEQNVGIIVRGGIAQGGPDAVIQRAHLDRIWQLARLDEVVPAGMSRAEFILRCTLSHPACHTTIVGTSSRAHLEQNLAAARAGVLPESIVAEVGRRVAGALAFEA